MKYTRMPSSWAVRSIRSYRSHAPVEYAFGLVASKPGRWRELASGAISDQTSDTLTVVTPSEESCSSVLTTCEGEE